MHTEYSSNVIRMNSYQHCYVHSTCTLSLSFWMSSICRCNIKNLSFDTLRLTGPVYLGIQWWCFLTTFSDIFVSNDSRSDTLWLESLLIKLSSCICNIVCFLGYTTEYQWSKCNTHDAVPTSLSWWRLTNLSPSGQSRGLPSTSDFKFR